MSRRTKDLITVMLGYFFMILVTMLAAWGGSFLPLGPEWVGAVVGIYVYWAASEWLRYIWQKRTGYRTPDPVRVLRGAPVLEHDFGMPRPDRGLNPFIAAFYPENPPCPAGEADPPPVPPPRGGRGGQPDQAQQPEPGGQSPPEPPPLRRHGDCSAYRASARPGQGRCTVTSERCSASGRCSRGQTAFTVERGQS